MRNGDKSTRKTRIVETLALLNDDPRAIHLADADDIIDELDALWTLLAATREAVGDHDCLCDCPQCAKLSAYDDQ